WRPKASARAGPRAVSGVAPLVWPTNRAEPLTAAAALPISPSGTQSRIASPPGISPRPAGPSTSWPTARSARARAVPTRPAPTIPMRIVPAASAGACVLVSAAVRSSSRIGIPVGRELSGPLPRGSGHVEEYPHHPPDNLPEPGLPFAQVSDLTPAERRQKLIELYHEVKACHACPLSATRTNPVFGMGNADADLMFVGEAPGAEEDRQGLPFVGRAGKLLDELLAGIGMTRKEHAFIAN